MSGAPPLVSVIIPVYNGQQYIDAALESVFAQTYPRVEVVVVDDGSAEPIAPHLEAFSGRIKIVRKPNGGVASARNRGIQESAGELIALLDQDDVWLPDKLDKQVALMASSDRIGLVHSDVRYRDELQDLNYLKARPRASLTGRCYDKLFFGCSIAACTVMFRRSILQRVGVFDETIKGTDDYDFELRVSRHFELAYVDEPLAVYRVHGENWSRRDLDMLRNELAVVEKAVREDANLAAVVTAPAVAKRLREMLVAVGYAQFTRGAQQDARPLLRRALALRADPQVFLWWASTYLPPGLFRTLRAAKQAWSRA
jgi:glycosyltransferase involved in cell wall biosynthesis